MWMEGGRDAWKRKKKRTKEQEYLRREALMWYLIFSSSTRRKQWNVDLWASAHAPKSKKKQTMTCQPPSEYEYKKNAASIMKTRNRNIDDMKISGGKEEGLSTSEWIRGQKKTIRNPLWKPETCPLRPFRNCVFPGRNKIERKIKKNNRDENS